MSAVVGAVEVAEITRELEHALRSGSGTTTGMPLAATRAAVVELTDGLRDARAKGWPDG